MQAYLVRAFGGNMAFIYDQEEKELWNIYVYNFCFLVASVTLWVGRLLKGSYDMLMQAFGEFGEIKNIDVCTIISIIYLLENILSAFASILGGLYIYILLNKNNKCLFSYLSIYIDR